VGLVRTAASEEIVAFIFTVERLSEAGTTSAVNSKLNNTAYYW
jgi:hypothetical protein